MNKISALVLFCLGSSISNGQDTAKYLEFVYGKKAAGTEGYKTELVFGDIKVTKSKPLIVKTPNPEKTFRVFTFNQLFDKGSYRVIVTGGSDPFKPILITTGDDSTQIDQLQLLGNREPKGPNEEVIEEAIIRTESDITLQCTVYIWLTNESGERTKRKGDAIVTRNRYRISETGRIETLVD